MEKRFSLKTLKDKKTKYSIYRKDYQWINPHINSKESKNRSLKMKRTNFNFGNEKKNKNLISTKQIDFCEKKIKENERAKPFKLLESSKFTIRKLKRK